MKRIHRRSHFIIWLILAPVLIGIIALATSQRPGEPVNDTLPPALLQEGQ